LTDLPVGATVSAHVLGRAGEILKYAGLEKTMTIRKDAKVWSVRPQSLDMDEGKYTLELRSGNVVIHKNFFLGRRNGFDGRMQRHKKQIAYQQQVERKKLVRVIAQIESKAQEFARIAPKKDPSALRNWQQILESLESEEMKKANAGNNTLVYQDMWETLAKYQKSLLRMAQISDGRNPAGASESQQIVRDIQRLKQKAYEQSLFKTR
jgi:hypothetical protein